MAHLWKLGYAAEDIISNVFRVCKGHQMDKMLQLDFVQVSQNIKFKEFFLPIKFCFHCVIFLFFAVFRKLE